MLEDENYDFRCTLAPVYARDCENGEKLSNNAELAEGSSELLDVALAGLKRKKSRNPTGFDGRRV